MHHHFDHHYQPTHWVDAQTLLAVTGPSDNPSEVVCRSSDDTSGMSTGFSHVTSPHRCSAIHRTTKIRFLQIRQPHLWCWTITEADIIVLWADRWRKERWRQTRVASLTQGSYFKKLAMPHVSEDSWLSIICERSWEQFQNNEKTLRGI